MADVTIFSALRSAAVTKAGVTDLKPTTGRGWWPVINESFAGAWQRNVEVDQALVTANWAVFSCMTLIAGDIGKICLKLVERDDNGIWNETDSPAFSPVLRKPNRYQTRQKFIEQWILSKLGPRGNAYILKERDNRGIVVALYVLDPHCVRPLVAPDGSVYWQLHADDLAQIPAGLPAVPASEIIHDPMWCLHHPLCGVSPLYASGLAAMQGLKIQNHSTHFFGNSARPSGVLTAPAQISDAVAQRLKEHWESNYTGLNAGKVAVLGDGLKFESMTHNAVDSALVEQLKLTANMICATYHVPPHMIGAGPVPTNNNVEALELQYYSKAIQPLTESIEALLDDGLGLMEKKEGKQLGTYFELDDLLKMDGATMTTVLKEQVGAGITSPNEARARLNYGPVSGGESPFLQEQNWPIKDIANRPPPARPITPPADMAPTSPEDSDDPSADKKMLTPGAIKAMANVELRRLLYAH